MEDLERQLKSALAREEAPAWFEAKVLAAAARERSARRNWWQRVIGGGRLRWATALAAVGLVASGVVWQHERHILVRERQDVRDREAGENAKARLVMALQITSNKLHRIQQKLTEINRAN
jgi:hypothetical protein